MPWEGVTVSEQKQRFIEDYLLNYYSVTNLAKRFNGQLLRFDDKEMKIIDNQDANNYFRKTYREGWSL